MNVQYFKVFVMNLKSPINVPSHEHEMETTFCVVANFLGEKLYLILFLTPGVV